MESQAYGYSDNENGVRAQQDFQQGYNNDAHPFAAPPQEVQDFNQQRYNVQPQQFDQQYPQFDQQYPQQFNQQYSQPQTQFPYVQPYAYTPNNDDVPADHNTVAPSEVVVSLNGQDDVRNHKYNDDDNIKHETDQPTQDQNNKPEKAKPERAKTFKEYHRSITHWGSSDCIGGITSFLGIGSVFVILVLLITLMAYHFGKKDVSLTAIAGGLNYMAMNLNTDPILQLTWNGNDCAPDSTKIHFGRWPGTSSGCDCPITGLKTGHCSKNESKTCSDYSDIDYQDMFRWEGSVFCAKRARLNVDYVKASTCPTGFKSCCPSNVDPSQCSVGICMRDGLGCPLTDIAVLSTGNATDILVQGKYVHLSYTPGGNPVIDMDITNGDVPCFNANEQPKGGDYYLLESHADGCSTYGVDKLFSPMIDRTSETRVITFNNLPKGVLKLPGYKRITDGTNSYLSARKRITVANKDACLSLDTKILNNAGTAANDLNRFVSGTAITAMVFHSILVLIFCGLFYLAGRGGDCSDLMKGKNSGTWLFFYCIIMPIELIVYIVMVPLVRSARSDLVASQTYLGNLDKLGCFPIGPPKQIISDYNDAVDEVASTLDGLATSLLAITLICFGSIALGLIYKVKYRGY